MLCELKATQDFSFKFHGHVCFFLELKTAVFHKQSLNFFSFITRKALLHVLLWHLIVHFIKQSVEPINEPDRLVLKKSNVLKVKNNFLRL